MKKALFSFLSLAMPALCSAFPIKPWFDDVYEFQFDAKYVYSRFHRVDHAKRQLTHPFNANDLFLGVGLTASQWWDAYLELELADTTSNTASFRSGGLQVRHLWLDEFVGDPFSLTSGVVLRGVTHYSLKDLSSPYHGEFDAELNTAIGREWSQGPFWTYRIFALGALGIANKGSGWAKAFAAFEGNGSDTHQYGIFAEGYFGFGSKESVNARHFHGWGLIHHQSIDLGIRYRYQLQLWGAFSIAYAYRPFARSYPEHVNTLILSYHLPFSLL